MEDVYLIHTYDLNTTNKLIYKNVKGEHIQTNVLKYLQYSNVLVQIYTKIINFVQKN
jgi:hypothetical protein